MSQQIPIVFVCLGNICRSPLAEGVFRHKVLSAGLEEHFEIDSAGTSSYHVGESPDPGSIRVASQNGIDITSQRSRQFRPEDFEVFRYIVAMDQSNRRNIRNIAPRDADLERRLWLMRNFEDATDGSGRDRDVPDPWGGGRDGFKNVYRIVDRASENLLAWLTSRYDL